MQHATKYIPVDNIPHKRAISIEWPEQMVGEYEKNILLGTDEANMVPLLNVDILLSDVQNEGALSFIIKSDKFDSRYVYRIVDGHVSIQNASTPLYIAIGRNVLLLSDYLSKDANHLTIRFVDGTALVGHYLAEYKNEDVLYSRDKIEAWDWTGINIRNESQGKDKDVSSIQYRVIQKLKEQDFDIIFDDDNAGEIADVIALKVDDVNKKVKAELYHLKFSQEERAGARINDLYAVNGQAQKCVEWLHTKPEHILGRMLRRGTTEAKNRYEVGTEKQLTIIREKVKSVYEIEYEVYIVQPGLSKAGASDDQLKVLSLTEAFLWETRMIRLGVIASS